MALQLPCRARQAVELRQARLSVWVGGWVGGWGGSLGRPSSTASSTALLVTENGGQRVRAGTAERVARPLRGCRAAQPAGGVQLAITALFRRPAGGGGI